MKTRDLTLLALLIALTTVATMIVRIPVPATGGYINMGDSMVYIAALLFGPVFGLVAGGVGSALADYFGGYGAFAPYTLVIKGLEGLLVGLLAWRLLRNKPATTPAGTAVAALAVLVGGAAMVSGYFVAEAYVLGLGVAKAAQEVPGNIFQVVGGLIVALPGSLALRRIVPATR